MASRGGLARKVLRSLREARDAYNYLGTVIQDTSAMRAYNALGHDIRAGAMSVRGEILKSVDRIMSAVQARLAQLTNDLHSGNINTSTFAGRFLSQLRSGYLAVKALGMAGLSAAYRSMASTEFGRQILYFKSFIDRIGNQLMAALNTAASLQTPLDASMVDWESVMKDRKLLKMLAHLKMTDPATYAKLASDPLQVLRRSQPSLVAFFAVGLLTGKYLHGYYEKKPFLQQIIGNGQYQRNQRAAVSYGGAMYALFWDAARQSIGDYIDYSDQERGQLPSGAPQLGAPAPGIPGPVDPLPPLVDPEDSAPIATDPGDTSDPVGDMSIVPITDAEEITDVGMAGVDTSDTGGGMVPVDGGGGDVGVDDGAGADDEGDSAGGDTCYEEMRILEGGSEESGGTPDGRNCADCIAYAGYWAPQGTLPSLNTLECLNNCRCQFAFRRCGQEDFEVVAGEKPGQRAQGFDLSRFDMYERARMRRLEDLFSVEVSMPNTTQEDEGWAFQQYSEYEDGGDSERSDAPMDEATTADAPDDSSKAEMESTDSNMGDMFADDQGDTTPGLTLEDANDSTLEPEDMLGENDDDNNDADPDLPFESLLDGMNAFGNIERLTESNEPQGIILAEQQSGSSESDKAGVDSQAESVHQATMIDGPKIQRDIQNLEESESGFATTAEAETNDIIADNDEVLEDLTEAGNEASELRGDEEVMGDATMYGDGIFEQLSGDASEMSEELLSDSIVETNDIAQFDVDVLTDTSPFSEFGTGGTPGP